MLNVFTWIGAGTISAGPAAARSKSTVFPPDPSSITTLYDIPVKVWSGGKQPYLVSGDTLYILPGAEGILHIFNRDITVIGNGKTWLPVRIEADSDAKNLVLRSLWLANDSSQELADDMPPRDSLILLDTNEYDPTFSLRIEDCRLRTTGHHGIYAGHDAVISGQNNQIHATSMAICGDARLEIATQSSRFLAAFPLYAQESLELSGDGNQILSTEGAAVQTVEGNLSLSGSDNLFFTQENGDFPFSFGLFSERELCISGSRNRIYAAGNANGLFSRQGDVTISGNRNRVQVGEGEHTWGARAESLTITGFRNQIISPEGQAFTPTVRGGPTAADFPKNQDQE